MAAKIKQQNKINPFTLGTPDINQQPQQVTSITNAPQLPLAAAPAQAGQISFPLPPNIPVVNQGQPGTPQPGKNVPNVPNPNIPGAIPNTIAKTPQEIRNLTALAEEMAARSQSKVAPPTPPPTAEQQALAAQVGTAPTSQTSPAGGDTAPSQSAGGINSLTGGQQIDVGQAVSKGIQGSVLTGAGVGAAIGVLGGPAAPLTIPTGAVAGAVAGFVGGVISSLKSQTGEQITGLNFNLTKGERNMRAIVTDTNKNPHNAVQNIQLFNEQLAAIDASYSKLRTQSQSDLNKFVGQTGHVELAKYEAFYSPGGQREFLVRAMRQAMLQPNPAISYVTFDDLTQTNE